jgi:hypothetical protein
MHWRARGGGMNIKAYIILALALISIAQVANTIEIGLIQEYGEFQSSYAYNSSVPNLTNVLCSPTSMCNFREFYYCDAIDMNISCDTTIYAPDPGCTPNYQCYDEDDNTFHPEYFYECPGMDYSIRCDITIPPNIPPDQPVLPPHKEPADDSDEPANGSAGPAVCPDLPAPMVVVPGLGNGTFKPPESSHLIKTSEWGEVPANQILVAAKDNCTYCMVCELADGLKGEVVGYIDFINLYQIETLGKDEADLRNNISQALEIPCIELAFPHQKVFPERSPLDDPVYSKGRDRSYRIVGVPQSWDDIRNSGLALSEVKIGVVDDGLYKGYGEFDGVVRIDTKSNGSLLEKPSPEYPVAGSHGTGIMNIIAADPDNGGLVGIASEPLRDKLTVTMINMLSPMYSESGDAWYLGYLLALSEAGVDSDIMSFSWGNSEADPGAVSKSREFFQRWADARPNRLFVCSAGNDGKPMDGSRRFPYTHNLPNVVTVGCINNNGTPHQNSNRISGNFEVTIAVPGDQVVWGKDAQGRIEDSGGKTSMSVPFVTATAALVRSLNPGLNASSIKSLLVETARTSIDVDGSQVPVPNEVGDGVLATDLAVQRVIADLRNSTRVMA